VDAGGVSAGCPPPPHIAHQELLMAAEEKDHTFLGQFEKNDNVYFVLRHAF